MEYLSSLSSIATLILFIIYFVGRFWNVKIGIKTLYEKIEVVDINEENSDIDIIYINGNETIKILSESYLNWIKIYSAEEKKDKIVKTSRKPIKKISDVNRNEPVYLKISIPEGFPNTIIEYQRSDYITGTFVVEYDGRGTGYTPNFFKIKATIRAYIYYFFK